MAMIVTGRTLDEMRGEEYDVAREQVLSYLTGRVGTTIGRSCSAPPAWMSCASSRS